MNEGTVGTGTEAAQFILGMLGPRLQLFNLLFVCVVRVWSLWTVPAGNLGW